MKVFHYLITFKLGDLFECNKTCYLDDLKKNEPFLSLCRKYDLSFEEAIPAMQMNHRKLEAVLSYDDKKLLGFKRK